MENNVSAIIATSNKVTNKKHKCKICGQTLSMNTNLRAHIDSVHRKIKSSKCEYCNQKFGYGTSLKRHVQLIHESDR